LVDHAKRAAKEELKHAPKAAVGGASTGAKIEGAAASDIKLDSFSKKNYSVNSLLDIGNKADKGGLTSVGRSLQKHGSRERSIYPKAIGNNSVINKQGEQILKEILTHADVEVIARHHARFGDILEYRIPGGMGARFSHNKDLFIGFIEP